MISTVDPDARHVRKSMSRRQDGFKAHLAVEPDTGIITDCALTTVVGADNHEAAVGLALLGGEDEPVTYWPILPMGQGNSVPNWSNTGIPTGSNPHQCPGLSRVGSPSMISSSITTTAPSPAPMG